MLGGGVNGHCILFKMLIMMHCIFILVIKNRHFQSTLLGGREGVTKEYSMYAFDNVDNYGRALRGCAKLNKFALPTPTTPLSKLFLFGNPSKRWTEHSNHNDYNNFE